MPTHEDNGHRAGSWDDYFGVNDRGRRRWVAAVLVAGISILALGVAKTQLLALAIGVLTFMNAAPPILLFPVVFVLAGLPSTLLHEAGHALAADLRVGSAAIKLNLIPDPRRPSGWCYYDASRATRRDTAVIALAGPAASALGALLGIGLYRAAGSHGLWHDICWALVAANVMSVVVNLLPLQLTDRDGSTLRLDGRVALDALRSRR